MTWKKAGDAARDWCGSVSPKLLYAAVKEGKAHGQTPAWLRDHSLSPASRAAFQAIDLTFHDLRHEAGSRLLEAGWPIHNVAHMLGHANISQTSTYLNATRIGLQDAMLRLDRARATVDSSPDGELDKTEAAAEALIN